MLLYLKQVHEHCHGNGKEEAEAKKVRRPVSSNGVIRGEKPSVMFCCSYNENVISEKSAAASTLIS